MPRSTKNVRHPKITVVLLQSQIAALDHLAVNIRLNTGKAFSRAGIISALIAAAVRKPRAVVEGMLLVTTAKHRVRKPPIDESS